MASEILWAGVGLVAAIFTATSFIPQLIKQWRTPDRAHVSYGTLAAFLIGSSTWALYGVHLGDRIIIGANCFMFCTLVVLAVLQGSRDLFRKRPPVDRENP